MSEDKAPLIEAISKLELAPGDVLVVKLPLYPDVAQMKNVQKYISQVVGHDIKYLILGPDIDLTVLTRKEIEERTI